MKNKELYQATFVQVHSSAEIRWEDMEMKAHRQRPLGRRMLMLAAVVGLIAVLSATAVAADWFGLRQLLLPGGREQGILHGANVVMPNLSPEDAREKYTLYDNKLHSGAEAAESLNLLRQSLSKIGYEIPIDKGSGPVPGHSSRGG